MTEYGLAEEFVDIEVEDELTKAVFGCLQLLGVDALNKIFSAPRYDFKFRSSPEFTFHEMVENREPDAIIEDQPNLTLMIEAKKGAPTDTQQLADEFEDLRQRWDSEKLRLIHITEDRLKPQNLESKTGIPSQNLIWTTWRNLAASLLHTKTLTLPTADRRIIEMLIQIFENHGYAPFEGFNIMDENQNLREQLNQAYNVRKQYYKDINSFRKDVESNLSEGISYWKFFRRGVSGGMTSGLQKFPTSSWEYLPRNLWFGYVSESGPIGLAGRDYDESYLILDFNSATGDIRAGFSVTTAPGRVKNDVYRKVLHERRETILELIQDGELQAFTTSYSLSTKLDTTEGIAQFLEEIDDPSEDDYTYDDSSLGRRFILGRSWSAEELPLHSGSEQTFTPTQLPQDVARTIEEVHQLTHHEHEEIFYPNPKRFE